MVVMKRCGSGCESGSSHVGLSCPIIGGNKEARGKSIRMNVNIDFEVANEHKFVESNSSKRE